MNDDVDAPRRERDSMGELEVPAAALWGAQTQRAVLNFPVSGERMPRRFVEALLLAKAAAARANVALGLLPAPLGAAIADAALALVDDPALMSHFPVDVFQTGSGTSSNMNANEVLATLAGRALDSAVSPNDHVNAAQSSNDTIPTAIHVAAALALERELQPALAALAQAIRAKAEATRGHLKTGRTHLMDALPLRFDQALGGWAAQVEAARARLAALAPALREVAQGGTAIGTGVNAPTRFAELFCRELSALARLEFRPAPDRFAAIASQDTAVAVSGELKAAATALAKIANDLRWMNSGPLAGLGEIELPALQPGSSIMPGKVNPVVPESVLMVCAQVVGHDAAIGLAGMSGSFELNTMLPLVARNLLRSIDWLAAAARLLGERAIAGFTVRQERLDAALARNPVLVTALNPVIGYLKAAEIAKRAYAEGRPILDVAAEMTDLPRERLAELLDPARLTEGGL